MTTGIDRYIRYAHEILEKNGLSPSSTKVSRQVRKAFRETGGDHDLTLEHIETWIDSLRSEVSIPDYLAENGPARWALVTGEHFVFLNDDVTPLLIKALGGPGKGGITQWRLHHRNDEGARTFNLSVPQAQKADAFLKTCCDIQPTRHGGGDGRRRASLLDLDDARREELLSLSRIMVSTPQSATNRGNTSYRPVPVRHGGVF